MYTRFLTTTRAVDTPLIKESIVILKSCSHYDRSLSMLKYLYKLHEPKIKIVN